MRSPSFGRSGRRPRHLRSCRVSPARSRRQYATRRSGNRGVSRRHRISYRPAVLPSRRSWRTVARRAAPVELRRNWSIPTILTGVPERAARNAGVAASWSMICGSPPGRSPPRPSGRCRHRPPGRFGPTGSAPERQRDDEAVSYRRRGDDRCRVRLAGRASDVVDHAPQRKPAPAGDRTKCGSVLLMRPRRTWPARPASRSPVVDGVGSGFERLAEMSVMRTTLGRIRHAGFPANRERSMTESRDAPLGHVRDLLSREPIANRERARPGASAGIDLSVQVGHVAFDGVDRQAERGRDLGIGLATGRAGAGLRPREARVRPVVGRRPVRRPDASGSSCDRGRPDDRRRSGRSRR